MRWDEQKSVFVFTTGTKAYANRGLLCCPEYEEGKWQVLYGYDGGFHPKGSSFGGFTPAERLEIADYMLERWQAFKDAATKEATDGHA